MIRIDRRDAIKAAAVTVAAALALPPKAWGHSSDLFKISLAQWSLHRTFFGTLPAGIDRASLLHSDPDRALQGSRHPLEFPAIAREEYGLEGVEYVNTFMYGHADDKKYLTELNRRAADSGVRSLLIMCDLEGALGDPDSDARSIAVDNHLKWLRAAACLGCHSIRVNAQSSGAEDEQVRLAADGLRRLAELAEPFGLNVIVENHGGLSSRGSWLMKTLRTADHPRLGTLPDFGNFNISETEEYDRYLGVSEMMPLARSVSAKSHDFDEAGGEVGIDYRRMMKIVVDAGYHSWVGIEYEGTRLSESEGIRATLHLLKTIRTELEQ